MKFSILVTYVPTTPILLRGNTVYGAFILTWTYTIVLMIFQ